MAGTSWRNALALALTLAAAGAAGACADDARGGGDGADPDGSMDADADADTDADTDADADADGAAVTEQAQNSLSPVDIVIAVDNSGSMTEEAGFVQENMNAFSEQISASGVNAHIALISATNEDDNGICVGEPLGSGSCPDDTALPGYLHVPVQVGSSDSLMKIRTSYGQWSSILRYGSFRHVVVVSDDDALAFLSTENAAQNWLNNMAGLVPPFGEFTFHAIVSDNDGDGELCEQDPPDPCCGLAASEGRVYKHLVEMTGGVLGNLCEQDFQPVFDELATEIADVPIACEWVIPDPPDGEVFDKDKVNVDYIDGDGETHEIGYVGSEEHCADVEHGWFYDDPVDPTTIRVCPQTCEWIQSDLEAQIVIKFGCTTVEAVG